MLSFSRQACRDTWFHPKSFTGHAIDHLLCRSRDHRFLGALKALFEATVGEAWSAYTDHNPVEVRLAKCVVLIGFLSGVLVKLHK